MSHPRDIYDQLFWLYDRFNTLLFDAALPPCMLTLRNKGRAAGYFQYTCFGAYPTEQQGSVDHIALNTEMFRERTEEDICSTLVHEMVHLWQYHFGEDKPKKGYHNREWGLKMRALGLMPSNTGQLGGKQTGVKMSHYILRDAIDGPVFASTYQRVCGERTPLLTWHEVPVLIEKPKPRPKLKYLCSGCEAKAWAYEGTQLQCGACETVMENEEAATQVRQMLLGV